MVKKRHRHASRPRVPAPGEKETALRQHKTVVAARAELLGSAPTETPQPTRPASIKVADAAPVAAAGVAALAPVVAKPATDQLAPDHRTPRQFDVETLLAGAPATSDAGAASMPPALLDAIPIADVGDDARGWSATWLGVLLMALGLVSLLSSSRAHCANDLAEGFESPAHCDGNH
jgi:hypothetical protein